MDRAPPPIARILEFLRVDDLDAAIDAGLMRVDPTLAEDAPGLAAIAAAQQRLSAAWAARARFVARAARLEQLTRERAARRRPAAAASAGSASPVLPAAAAQALARAMAKAAGKP